jgi:peptidoglycan/xylan/chitin deacetylase (PgdA/CDA1 family)
MVEAGKQKNLHLTFDMEEFFGNQFGLGMPMKKMYELSMPGTERLVDLAARLQFRATFFFTLKFAEFCPGALSSIIAQGHEIACHGYHHDHDYSSMPEEESRDYIKRSKCGLEDMTGQAIRGFRAPQFYHPSHTLLGELGFEYDSSLHPTIFNVNKRLKRFLIGGSGAASPAEGEADNRISLNSRRPFFHQGILVVPVTVTPWGRLPFSWVWFRNAGLGYAKLCTRLTMLSEQYVHLYFHPYDFSDLDRPPFNQVLSRSFVRNTGMEFLAGLEAFVHWTRDVLGLRSAPLVDLVPTFRAAAANRNC